MLAASGASGWTADGSGLPPPPSWAEALRRARQAPDDTAHQIPAAAAVLGRRVERRLLATMVEFEGDAVVVALDLPLATIVGHVLPLHRRGVTVVLTLDPAGCTVVTRIG